jgi:hypothetical protein
VALINMWMAKRATLVSAHPGCEAIAVKVTQL